MKTIEVDEVTFTRLLAIARAANYFGRWNIPYLRESDGNRQITIRACELVKVQDALELPKSSKDVPSPPKEIDDLTERVRKLEQLTQTLVGETLVRKSRIRRRIIPWTR